MIEQKYDVVFIGGGISSLVSAALLAKKGLKTLILEKADQVGGRYRSFEAPQKGYTLSGFSGPFFGFYLKKALEEVGAKVNFVDLVGGTRNFYNVRDGRMASWPTTAERKNNPNSLKSFFADLSVSGDDLNEFMKVIQIFENYSDEELSKLDSVSIKDWVKGVTKNQNVRDLLWNLVMLQTSCTISEAKDASVRKSFIHFWYLMLGKTKYTPGLFCANDPRVPGSGAVPKAFEEVVLRNGGIVKTLVEAKTILTNDGRVTGVVYRNTRSDGWYLAKASHIVSSCKVWENFENKLLSEEHFSRDWISNVKRLKLFRSGVLHTWVGINLTPEVEKKLGKMGLAWVRFIDLDKKTNTYTVNAGYYAPHSHWSTTMAPKGKHIGCTGAWLTTEKATDYDNWKQIEQDSLNRTRHFFGNYLKLDFDSIVEWKETTVQMPTWGVEMYTVYPQPEIKCPTMEGMYFIGDSVAGESVAGDRAVYTGKKCAEIILNALVK